MSRDHVEFVRDSELDWRHEELTDELPAFENKLLSVDEETGAFTRVVELDADWSASGVTFPSLQELYVVAGQLTVDGHELTADSYLRIPEELSVASMHADETTRVFWTSDCALDASGDHDGHRFWRAPESDLTVVDATEMEWQGTAKEGPEEGLMIKHLWVDDETGAATFLAKASEWVEHRQEHHDCVETSYTLSGGMTMGERGTMTEGDYFWRPPHVRHGPMEPADEGFVALLRVDRTLVNHYTSVDGVPLNY
jgi:quercetin dioxygenase-like cupin family protein